MALAILALREIGRDGPVFTLDTGSSRFYELRAGRTLGERAGLPWVDDVVYASPIAENPRAAPGFNSQLDRAISGQALGAARFAQLFSFKTRDRIAPTFSNVVELPFGRTGWQPTRDPETGAMNAMTAPTAFAPSAPTAFAPSTALRRIAHVDAYAHAASTDDVLGSIVRLAAPIVAQLLGGGGSGGRPVAASGSDAIGTVLAMLLQALLPGGQPLGKAQSIAPLGGPGHGENRFSGHGFARQMIFGIDDALIGALAGPLLQVLPQLMNAANQGRLQDKQATNTLMTDLVASVNQRMLLQQLINAQPQVAASPDLARLAALLQQAGAAGAAPAGPPPAGSLARQASLALEDDGMLSKRAVVSFRGAPALACQGGDHLVFARHAAIALPVELTVGAPVPTSAIPRIIARLTMRLTGSDAVLVDKTYKLRDVKANTPLTLALTVEELALLPANEPVETIIQFRWKTAGATVFKALGAIEAIFIDGFVLKQEGAVVDREIELTDMTQYRSYWNKIWEAPVLDAGSGAAGKRLWSANLAVRYSVVLSAIHASNAVMATKMLLAPAEPDGLNARADGRLKSGIEISIAQLNALSPQWPGRRPLSPEQLGALNNGRFAAANAGETIAAVKMDGRAGERGMIWAVPTFVLRRFVLGQATATDANGQVTALSDTPIEFPVPASVRLLGIKSKG